MTTLWQTPARRALLAIPFLITGVALGQSNPVKLATQARFDLLASVSVGALTNGYILEGSGALERQTWLAAADQPRSYTANLSIFHFTWTELVARFTPAGSGTVELTLRGPWQRPPDGGAIYKQEVLWDALSAENTVVPNGSFEMLQGALPTGWSRPYGTAYATNDPLTAVDGARMARVWHDAPLTCALTVTGGVPVTLRFFARAQTPADFTDLARITNRHSAAHQAARRFMRGANLGNYLEAPPGQNWGAQYRTNDFAWIRAEGFDHVRLPIAWHHYTGPPPDYLLSSTIFTRADFLVTNALRHGLRVLVNIHHFDDFTTNPAAWTNKFYAIWRQVAAHYANASPALAFELINEPKDAATTSVLNPIYAEAIRQIRVSNPSRTLFVGPGQWNSINELSNLRLPDDDENLIVTVHCYDPFLFTHQGASWTLPDTATTNLVFPGPPATPVTPAPGISAGATNWLRDYNTLPADLNPCSPRAFRGLLRVAQQWSEYYGRPVHVGEFGAYHPYVPADSRVRFYWEIRACMDELGLGWAMWDWKAGFHYWKESGNSGAPDPPGMRDALFPRPRLRLPAAGKLEAEGAVGKTFVVQRAPVLAAVPVWQNLTTQTLATPQWRYEDPTAPALTSSWYRLEWRK
ncbi:MAG: Endoglucanase H precursor [Verrucomicrobia bacterium ADurb.Bin118]|jgi:endoglucanase|nr:MAG: Endoglucanase H precursor [Verrucomicrobia bacterium ADurb.Bin118]